MKQSIFGRLNLLFTVIFIFVLQAVAFAQDKIVIDEGEVKGWFARNWMWIVAGVVLLLLIAIFSRGSSRRRTTTVVKDQFGDVRSVTTTEVKD